MSKKSRAQKGNGQNEERPNRENFPVAKWRHARPVDLMRSPAMRVLSRAAHLALLRIELELRDHAGNDNGKLIVTRQQFVEFGLDWRTVASALRELEALGIIRIQHGHGGSAKELRAPNRFLLNYLCGAKPVPDTPITNDWEKIKTVKEAAKIAHSARKDKNPAKVSDAKHAHALRKAQNIAKNSFSPGYEYVPGAGTQTSPENDPISGYEDVPAAPPFSGTYSSPTIEKAIHSICLKPEPAEPAEPEQHETAAGSPVGAGVIEIPSFLRARLNHRVGSTAQAKPAIGNGKAGGGEPNEYAIAERDGRFEVAGRIFMTKAAAQSWVRLSQGVPPLNGVSMDDDLAIPMFLNGKD